MKQQVDITMKLSLWLDASMDADEIVTHIRSTLPNAFGEELTDMLNPVDILDVREEAAIYGPTEPCVPTRSPWAVYRLADDPETYGANAGRLIVTTADWEIEVTGPLCNEADAYVIAAAPKLLHASQTAWRRAANHEKLTLEECNQLRDAITVATRRAA